jgi:putative ABC transport system ATP-binding protein
MFMEIRNITKIYPSGDTTFRALDSVSFSADKGQRCVILGPSGSGKSTLLNILGGIDRADAGEAVIAGTDITKLSDAALTDYRRDAVGFVFQFYNLIPNLTVFENVEVAAAISREPLDIFEVLCSVGLGELRDRFPRQLSGGQQQRVSIARALVKRPKLLLCDEPTGALDISSSREVLKLLEDVGIRFGTTVFIITHNNAIAGMAQHIIRLSSGTVAEDLMNGDVIPAERIVW